MYKAVHKKCHFWKVLYLSLNVFVLQRGQVAIEFEMTDVGILY